MKKRIAIIYGGYSSEFEISEKSATTIYNSIDTNLFEPFMVEITEKNWQVHIRGGVTAIDRNNFTYLLNDKINYFDNALITIHGTPGEDGKLQAYFDMIKMSYVNSGLLASALSFNKWACNSFLRDHGISTAKAILLRNTDEVKPIQIANELGFPCFVKPNGGGSSFGISKVKTLMEMPEAIAKAFTEGEEVVIESFIEGRELTCGVYSNGKEVIALPCTEIITPNEFFDYNAKYKGESNEITPAGISSELTKEIQNITKKIYKRMGFKSIARMDYFLTESNEIFLIEANTNPGMTSQSLVPQQIVAAGLEIKQVLTEILNS